MTDHARPCPAELTVDRERSVADYRKAHPPADRWAAGYGVIEHNSETQARVFAMADALALRGVEGDGPPLFEVLEAADRVASAGMWLVVHQTYAHDVFLDGRDLLPEHFKPEPEGHTGGSLNMVPAYTGYFAVNAITGQTRSWLMGQGHCVAAIDSLNLLLDNMREAHAERYSLSDDGLTRYVRDFYSYELGPDGEQLSPLGSHVNVHTAGGMIEGGYLGFAELQYVHMPLPGEQLVIFLSDGAFEEQRGSDWAPRWWRAEDCGTVLPIMIANGRRIDQRTTLSQQGGVQHWLVEHLRLNHFDPIVFDGRDPAAFAWAIYEMESRLADATEEIRRGEASYPVWLPYGVAVAQKGAGFVNAGTNLAHNLPLMGNPHTDTGAATVFKEAARRLWVPHEELRRATKTLQHHDRSSRARERDHPLAHRQPAFEPPPRSAGRPVPNDRSDHASWTRSSPMRAVDETFMAHVRANPRLRPRVGNPDEMRSNRLTETLEQLKFRVTAPEQGVPEAVHGAVITALNEEAVAAAALGNKGGINLVATYEAFGAKMHGIFRQEITFAESQREAGQQPGWLSVPLVLTSHAWENSKNERSHQDPAMAELLLEESSHVSRVVFPPDANGAAEALRAVYETRGQIWALVTPKGGTPDLFTPQEARRLVEQGGLRLEWAGHEAGHPLLLLTAVGAYQLEQVLLASERLARRGVAHAVNYLLEPGRFRAPRSEGERAHLAPQELVHALYPEETRRRVFVGHIRPEVLIGVLRPLDSGPRTTGALGFTNRGGTLDIAGMLFVNHSSWAHIVAEAARVLELAPGDLLTEVELDAIGGRVAPRGVLL